MSWEEARVLLVTLGYKSPSNYEAENAPAIAV